MAIYCGRSEAFHDDQLIVTMPGLRVVKDALTDLGVRWAGIDESADLRLARIHGLNDVHGAAERLRETFGIEIQRFQKDQAELHGRDAADLEILVRGLHLRFAREFPGWEVAIGKNYTRSKVAGHPHYGGGYGAPEPAGKPLSLPDSAKGSGVRVGVLDTRLYPAEVLTGHYIARRGDLLDPGKDPFTVFDGHCAFVSSRVLMQAPAAEIHLHQVLDSAGDGSSWDAAEAVAEMARAELDVVNLSFGDFLTDDNTAPMVMENAVKRFGPDTVVVAAAANNGDARELTAGEVRDGIRPNSASYPAALPDVVAVGSLDQDGELAAFTPEPAPWISLLATGVGLTGAYVAGRVVLARAGEAHQRLMSFNGQAVWSGNSFAAGVVTGEIAARTVPGRRTARQVLDDLLRSGSSGPGWRIKPNV